MAIQNFKIKHGISVGDHDLVTLDQSGNPQIASAVKIEGVTGDISTEIGSKVSYYEQANPPTYAGDNARAGDLWKDTDTSILYYASVDTEVVTWIQL